VDGVYLISLRNGALVIDLPFEHNSATRSLFLAAKKYQIAALGVLLISVLLTPTITFLCFERFLALGTFEDFRSEKILHECIA
jgi:hypothetical protein